MEVLDNAMVVITWQYVGGPNKQAVHLTLNNVYANYISIKPGRKEEKQALRHRL